MLMPSITIFDFSNIAQKAYAQSIIEDDLVVKKPSNTINAMPLMSFVEGVYGDVPSSVAGSQTQISLRLYKEGCNTNTFNITVPSTSNNKYFLHTSVLKSSSIFLAYTSASNEYTYATINYTISGCTFNLSTTSPTWTNSTHQRLSRQYPPIWISDRVYFLNGVIYNYDNGSATELTQLHNYLAYVPVRTPTKLVLFGYYSQSSYVYICTISYSTYSANCQQSSVSNVTNINYIYDQNSDIIYFLVKSGSSTPTYILYKYNVSADTFTQMQNSSTQLFMHNYGSSFLYHTSNYTYYPAFIPLKNTNGTTSVFIEFASNEYKYYKTESMAYDDFKGPIGNLTQNPYHHILYASSGMLANVFDANFNLVASINLTNVPYQTLRFPQGIKYIQLVNTSNNQSIIYSKIETFTPTSNLNYLFDQYLTTVVMTPITFSRLNTDENYYYVEVVQNKPYKNELPYYAKFIDQSSQVTVALRQAQCSYLKLHVINKSSLNESTMSFMVCEDGISKTIEIPNTVNFVYANDVIFQLYRYSDYVIGISANKDLNTQTKVTVCSTIDRALFDFENNTLEGVTIAPADAQITYVNVTTTEKAMKVSKNSGGDYIYEFPIKRHKALDTLITVKFIPQDTAGGTVRTYSVNFYLNQYNSSKQFLSNITLVNQGNYSGFSSSSYNNYTEYSRTFSISASTFNPDVEYIQLFLKFTASSVYHNHLVNITIDTNMVHRYCHNYALFDSMIANTIYTLEDNVKSLTDKEILILHNNQIYSNSYFVNTKTPYSSSSIPALTFENKIKAIFDEFSNRITGSTTNSITFFLAVMSILFFSLVITRNIAVMYVIFILIVSVTAAIYNTEILTINSLVILAFMAIALAIWYRYR